MSDHQNTFVFWADQIMREREGVPFDGNEKLFHEKYYFGTGYQKIKKTCVFSKANAAFMKIMGENKITCNKKYTDEWVEFSNYFREFK